MISGLALDPTAFLRDHWQRRPLLTRVSGDFEPPLSAEELAGLAMEEDVESRLVRGTGNDMRLEHGPFEETAFRGDEPWTLLVQCVDHYVPAVASLRKLVAFLPAWQIDDVMVSYATDGGGVGPHYDNYDVFLLQGEGQRLWRLGQRCKPGEPQRDSSGLKLLADFRQEQEFLLNPGDVLYVPPGVAHWGIARGPGMTYSIGFRAPALNELLSRWVDASLPLVDPELLYRERLPAGAAGEISQQSVAGATAQLQELLATLSPGPDWFGEIVTETREGEAVEPEGPLPATVVIEPASRLAWYDTGETIGVYANGERLQETGPATLLGALCEGNAITSAQWPEAGALLEALWERGCLKDA